MANNECYSMQNVVTQVLFIFLVNYVSKIKLRCLIIYLNSETDPDNIQSQHRKCLNNVIAKQIEYKKNNYY